MVILAGSPRGGEKTWKSLFKYVVDHLHADLAICTTDNFVSKNILFEKANYKWIMENPVNFENYYSKNYTGNWKEYLNKKKESGQTNSLLFSPEASQERVVPENMNTGRNLSKEAEEALKFRIEILVNKLNLVSREEFEVQKKITNKLIHRRHL